jgi:ATP-binding cassette subfamily B protein
MMRRPTMSAESGEGEAPEQSEWQTLKSLLPYLWPKGRADLKTRVVISALLLILTQFVTLYVPILFKMSIDAVTPVEGEIAAVPIFLILAYGLARATMQAIAISMISVCASTSNGAPAVCPA